VVVPRRVVGDQGDVTFEDAPRKFSVDALPAGPTSIYIKVPWPAHPT